MTHSNPNKLLLIVNVESHYSPPHIVHENVMHYSILWNFLTSNATTHFQFRLLMSYLTFNSLRTIIKPMYSSFLCRNNDRTQQIPLLKSLYGNSVAIDLLILASICRKDFIERHTLIIMQCNLTSQNQSIMMQTNKIIAQFY